MIVSSHKKLLLIKNITVLSRVTIDVMKYQDQIASALNHWTLQSLEPDFHAKKQDQTIVLKIRMGTTINSEVF